MTGAKNVQTFTKCFSFDSYCFFYLSFCGTYSLHKHHISRGKDLIYLARVRHQKGNIFAYSEFKKKRGIKELKRININCSVFLFSDTKIRLGILVI